MTTKQGDYIEGTGVAGTPNGGVLTVQGDPAGIGIPITPTGPILVDVNNVVTPNQPVAALGIHVAGARNASAAGTYSATPTLPSGMHVIKSGWLSLSVTGTSPGAGINDILLQIVDAHANVYAVAMIVAEENSPQSLSIDCGRLKPSNLIDTDTWTVQAVVTNIVGTATSNFRWGVQVHPG